MTYVMIIWLAVGSTRVEYFPASDACFRQLEKEKRAYELTYVIKAVGCFPIELIQQAAHH